MRLCHFVPSNTDCWCVSPVHLTMINCSPLPQCRGEKKDNEKKNNNNLKKGCN